MTLIFRCERVSIFLRQKKNRERENAYFIEGLRVVLSAIEAGAPIDIIVYSQKLLNSDVAWQMLTAERAAGTRCARLPEDDAGTHRPRTPHPGAADGSPRGRHWTLEAKAHGSGRSAVGGCDRGGRE